MNVWAKYLPVIRIVLKKSISSEQMFSLNISDFERAGLKRKSGYKFMIKLKEGKSGNIIIDSPVESAFIATVCGDESLKELLAANEFHITLNPKFQLTIKHIAKHRVVENETVSATEI